MNGDALSENADTIILLITVEGIEFSPRPTLKAAGLRYARTCGYPERRPRSARLL
jgi:hypothetical protein